MCVGELNLMSQATGVETFGRLLGRPPVAPGPAPRLAVLVIHWQSWVVATETRGPANPRILTVGPPYTKTNPEQVTGLNISTSASKRKQISKPLWNGQSFLGTQSTRHRRKYSGLSPHEVFLLFKMNRETPDCHEENNLCALTKDSYPEDRKMQIKNKMENPV